MSGARIVQLVTSCRQCPNRHYLSGGAYECIKVRHPLPASSEIPAWCPLPIYPTPAASPPPHAPPPTAPPPKASSRLRYPPLESITASHVSTETAAFYLNRAPQTLRKHACLDTGPIKPVRINRRLAWPVAELRRLLGLTNHEDR